MKTVYLHIGHFKTGSSAVQLHFSRNCPTEIYYPKTGIPDLPDLDFSQLWLADSQFARYKLPYNLRLMSLPALDFNLLWNNLRDELYEKLPNKVLISSESFIRFCQLPDPAACIESMRDCLADYSFKIIVFLRRPDKLIESWANQMLKTGFYFKPEGQNFNRIFWDFEYVLKPWITVFGDNVQIYNYDSIQDDIVPEFYNILGMKNKTTKYNLLPENKNKKKIKKTNTAFPKELLALKNECNRLSGTDFLMSSIINHEIKKSALGLPAVIRQPMVMASEDRQTIIACSLSVEPFLLSYTRTQKPVYFNYNAYEHIKPVSVPKSCNSINIVFKSNAPVEELINAARNIYKRSKTKKLFYGIVVSNNILFKMVWKLRNLLYKCKSLIGKF